MVYTYYMVSIGIYILYGLYWCLHNIWLVLLGTYYMVSICPKSRDTVLGIVMAIVTSFAQSLDVHLVYPHIIYNR